MLRNASVEASDAENFITVGDKRVCRRKYCSGPLFMNSAMETSSLLATNDSYAFAFGSSRD